MADWNSILGNYSLGTQGPGNYSNFADQSMVFNPNDPTVSDANTVDPVTKTPDFITQVANHPNVTAMVKALMSPQGNI